MAPVQIVPRLGGLYYGWLLIGTLGITETISWGALYYAFSVFLTLMQADLGWSRGATTDAFSLALVISGITAIPVGRWLDAAGLDHSRRPGSASARCWCWPGLKRVIWLRSICCGLQAGGARPAWTSRCRSGLLGIPALRLRRRGTGSRWRPSGGWHT